MSNIDSPIALSELESVLAWVDTFKLSRPTKKINRDFSDAGNSNVKLEIFSQVLTAIYYISMNMFKV